MDSVSFEGQLKRYKNIITGYKPVFIRVIPDTLLISKEVMKGKSGLEGSKVERINIKNAMVSLPKKAMLSPEKSDEGPQFSSDTDFWITLIGGGKKTMKLCVRAASSTEREQWSRALR